MVSLLATILNLKLSLRWKRISFQFVPRPGNVSATTTTDTDRCFSYGTNHSATKDDKCVCRDGWYGRECNVPEAVWTSPDFETWYSEGLIQRRSRPRIIINGFVINHEMDMLEIRIKELGDAVDYYLVLESNYTYFGTSKPLHLRSNLSAGFLSAYRHKIIPLVVGVYNEGDGDPWAPENYFRSAIWKEGRHHFPNIRADDLFMITDADEVPSRDLMLFLKYHDGYGEPISLTLQWFIYGFFWRMGSENVVSGICSIGYLRDIYQNDSLELRRQPYDFELYLNENETDGYFWNVSGIAPRFAGWHCSWCFTEVGIQVKLASAQRDDGVRWGDLANKTDLDYIASLRRTGTYFDGTQPASYVDALTTAPSVLKNDWKRWRYLLVP